MNYMPVHANPSSEAWNVWQYQAENMYLCFASRNGLYSCNDLFICYISHLQPRPLIQKTLFGGVS